MESNQKHSRLGASSYYRWKACPGSVRLSEGVPQSSSTYAEEGTLAHDIAARRLKGYRSSSGVTSEMEAAIQLYVDTIATDMRVGFKMSLLVEHTFDLSSVFPGMFGTADAVLYNPQKRLLRVYDFKYGAGIAVEVEKNPQLMYYGLGALLTLPQFKPLEVELVIVQPRCPHPDGYIRRDRVPVFNFFDFAADLEDDAVRTTAPDAPLYPGKHCRFCPAAGICPTLVDKAQALAKIDFAELKTDPDKLPQILHWLPVMEAWIKNMRDYAYTIVNQGTHIPGWKLVPKRAIRHWRNRDEVVEVLHKHGLTDDQIFYKKFKTPGTVEKLIKRPRNGDYWFSDLTITTSKGETLVPETDKRKSIRTNAKSEFERIE